MDKVLERLEKAEKEIAVLKKEQLFLQRTLLSFIKDEEALIEIVKQLRSAFIGLDVENTDFPKSIPE